MKRESLNKFIFVYAIFISLFHFYQNIWGGMSNLWFNAAHFSLLASLGFLTFRASKHSDQSRVPIYDIILAILTSSVVVYMMFFEQSLYTVAHSNMRPFDLIYATLAILLSLEILRRTTGYIIPTMIIIAIGYLLYFGTLLDGVFAFRGMSVERFLYRMYYTGEGLFGSIATISATYVFMFILFSAFLMKSGAGDFIVDLASVATSKFKGGSGHVALFSSALMGTISGSAVANVVSTGSITIPMMKKSGFRPMFAASVETSASTGGQIMPPIMGAGAFIMAQMTQIAFSTIIVLSILPAMLYFISISFYIHIHAKKHNIVSEDVNKRAWPIVREGFHFLIPIGTLVVLLIYGFTPTYAAGISMVAIVFSSYLTKNKRMSFRLILEALADGSKNMVVTGTLLVSIGVIVGVVNISGIGVTFSQLIMEWSHNSLLIALLLVSIAAIVLGMGLPTTASYVVLVVLSAPALVGLMLDPATAALLSAGVNVPQATMYLLAAHLMIFWLAQVSNLTPPVCLAAFAGAAIAETPPMQTGFKALSTAKAFYIMPLLFAFSPLITGTWPERFEVFAFAIPGFLGVAATTEGYWDMKMTILERGLFAVATFFLLFQDQVFNWTSYFDLVQDTNILGVIIMIVAFILHKRRYKKSLKTATITNE
ncbi:TRAP transporter permease [Sulfurospirillum sp. 1612]|uniref:TRAP transporter permease n=1 Tax=Sulfurospirillum sp. 1612 TaxID=3094835 RepID=UPI002F940D6C